MAEPFDPIPKLSAEQRQAVAAMAMRAKQALAAGKLGLAITLFLDCCKRDPINISCRQELRKTEIRKYRGNKTGRPLVFLFTWRPSTKMEAYAKTGNHLKAIECAEDVLRSNPWHVSALVVSARAFDALGLKDLALWAYDQARQVEPDNLSIRREMTILFHERGWPGGPLRA